MNLENNEEIELNVDDLFKDPTEEEIESGTDSEEKIPTEENLMTKAVSERINEVKRKTEQETKNNLAKELGYEDYQDMSRAREKKMLVDAGLDEEDISEVVEKLVTKRLAEDPRFKKLEELEIKEKAEFVSSELKEINKLTDNKFTELAQLPKDVLSLWEKTGNLKQAYLAICGEDLITKSSASMRNGSLEHLATPGSAGPVKMRALTETEKDIWRSTIPDITEEELSKKTMPIT